MCISAVSLFYTDDAFSYESGPALGELERGMNQLKAGDYGEAVRTFSRLVSDDFFMNDFALLWRAEASYRAGDLERAIADISIIKREYHRTAAFRNALRLELEILKATGAPPEDVASRYREYLGLYPEDEEVMFSLGLFLRDRLMDGEEAAEVFRKLYIKAGPLAEKASAYIDLSSLSLDEVMERGRNLVRRWEFGKAETAFRRGLGMAPAGMKDAIREKIALCRFRQKDYPAAAVLYGRLNDAYMEAVAYLRMGQREKFLSALGRLAAMRDPRAGILYIALANEKRRSGDYSGAIATLYSTLGKYPFSEDILWQIGWTRYLNGDRRGAADVFRELYERYGSDRYRYWMLRSMEGDASAMREEYAALCSRGNYYGFLACLRTGVAVRHIRASSNDTMPTESPLLKRFNVLKHLGLKDEAHFELRRLIRSLSRRQELILYSRKLKEIGEYRKAISVATMVPYSENTHELWYPVAYWDTIQSVAARFGVDPIYVLSIAREESRLDPEARSVAGAVGLMQLMPRTARTICRRLKCTAPADRGFFDVETNILLGTYYLKTLLGEFGSIPVATAAYNAGERTVRKWIRRGMYRETDEFVEDIPYPETRNYVKKVMTTLFQYSRSFGRFDRYSALIDRVSMTGRPD